MLQHPKFDPVAFSLGTHNLPVIGEISLDIRWYGLMYLIGFICAWGLGIYRAKKPNSGWTKEQVGDMVFYGAMGIILGGRFGYTFFYGMEQFLSNPGSIIKVWEGGMSFHGGFIGVMVAMIFFARKHQKTFGEVVDFLVPLAPTGIAAGRMGNFINGELWGRVSDVPWAMSFNQPDVYRHPSQLYEFALEGVLLFIIIWWFSAKPRPRFAIAGLFTALYGAFRFFVEFFREPDAHIGFDAGWMTRGQILSSVMVIAGIALIVFAYRRKYNATIS